MEKKRFVWGVGFFVVCLCLVGKVDAMNLFAKTYPVCGGGRRDAHALPQPSFRLMYDTSPQKKLRRTFEALITAIENDDVLVFKDVFQQSPMAFDIKGKTVFHLAVEYGSEKICTFLLEGGSSN